MTRETRIKANFETCFGLKRFLLQGYFLIGMLLLYSSFDSSAQINGPSTVCSGVATTFTLSGTPTPGYTYNWAVVPAANATILSSSSTAGTIQWLTNSSSTDIVQVTINRPGLTDIVWTKSVSVIPQPNPQITTNTIVGCQGLIGDPKRSTALRGDSGGIVDDGVCLKVCANSYVQYNVVGGQVGSTYQWAIDATKGTISGSSTAPTVGINWSGSLGFTFIKVKETTAAGCVKEKSICIQIIESPAANFSVNGEVTPPLGGCFESCVNSPVQFKDLTPVSLSSPIVSWKWDFGDGIFSSAQNPQHTYLGSGVYTVVLIVTNQCGCVGRYKTCITVNEAEQIPAQIQCPSIVCGNTIGHYTIDNTCPSMNWIVNGGTMLSATINSIDVIWDNVGSSGFGELIADFSACGGKCSPKVVARIPVIAPNAVIKGKNVICSNKQYRYQLPQWPATDFKWSVSPAGSATIVSYDENSNEIDIIATAPFVLHCDYINTLMLCAGKADLNIDVVPPLVLSAPEKLCIGTATSVVSTVPASSGTVFTFINPDGIVSTAPTFNMLGLWTVEAVNPGFCDIEPITILVVSTPVSFASLSGPTKVCLSTPYVYEAIAPLPNTICTWSISPAGAGTIIANSGNTVTVQWNTSGAKILSVSRTHADLPGCSSAATILNISDAVPSIGITGNTTPCANTTAIYTAALTAGSSTIDHIVWSLSNPALGSISAGQNTMTPTITWNNTNVPSSPCNIIATISKCGNTSIVSYPVSVIGVPAISISVSNPTPCSGVPVTFTATTIPASASVSWSLTGASPSTASGSTATTTFTNLGNASQNFTVFATASVTGCILTGNASNTISVKPQPNINVSPGAGSSSSILVCDPINVPLLLSTNATTSINWYFGASTSPFSTGTTSVTATSAGTYRVDVTNAFGCSSSATRIVVLDPSCDTCTVPAGAGANHTSSITSCANSLGEVFVDVDFTSIYGNYPPPFGSYTPGNILNLQVVGSLPPYCILPSVSFGSFPNVTVTGVKITKPGIYPVTLKIGYQQATSIIPCYKLISENVIVPVITDFDYNTNCVGGGYTLTLNDQTPILAGYSISAQSWNTTSSGGPTTTASSINLSAYTAGSTLNITRSVTVTGPAGTYTCMRTRTYTVPAYPNPNFSITTTDPTSTTASPSSCAVREVLFTSLNNAGISKWSWNFGDSPSPTSFVSNTSISATRTYTNPTASYNPTVTLTLNDAFGCSFSTSKQFNLLRNTFVLNTTNTYNLQNEIKCQGSFSSISLIGVSGGYGSNTYAWMKEETPLGLTSNPISVGQDGLYWTRVNDLHGCQVSANPTPAKRAFQPLPDVGISGAQDYCPGQAIKLSAANGASTGIAYQWQRLIGVVWTNIPGATSAVLHIPGGLPSGIYQYRVIASQNLPAPYVGSCPATSPAFIVTVRSFPNYPAIASPVAVNCDDYSIQLNVASPQAGITYNWSNGTSGTSTIVNHGGPYRVWATNIWGCKSSADVDVPIEPAAYFWRFPHGCYSFCPDMLPRQVNGPSYAPFNYWQWQLYGGSLPYPNGAWASSGSYSYVDPLNIHLDPTMGGNGNGSGDYQWLLDNGLCKQVSDPMSIDLKKECCIADAGWEYFNCIWKEGDPSPTYYGGLNVHSSMECKGAATYTIYALDPLTGLPNGTVSPVSGFYTPGTTISFAYTPFAGVSSVKFQVVISCDGRECIANPEVIKDLKEYPCSQPNDCKTGFELEHFKCVWPKSSPVPYFSIGIYVANPFGCAATTYIISAVDPITGLANGTIAPSTGAVAPGWSLINFNYTPYPGVSSVKGQITFICGKEVCTLDLGTYKGLDDEELYPCKKKIFFKETEETGFSILDDKVNMSIVPNPAKNDVQIRYNIPTWKAGDLYQITIVNLLGQTVAQYDVTKALGAWQYTTLQMSSGTYIVRLLKDGKSIDIQKMLIAH